ncbi:MAG: hypothetical protein H0X66_10315 [Verrucomicrobia bacterium]|nr:hypothetical protein [Verrucomicrobiota bacterium]
MKLQFLLPLEHTVTRERCCSFVDIPDRSTAEYELEKLKRRFKAELITAKIRKNRPGPSSTYTINYKVRETETVRLF